MTVEVIEFTRMDGCDIEKGEYVQTVAGDKDGKEVRLLGLTVRSAASESDKAGALREEIEALKAGIEVFTECNPTLEVTHT